ncbi:beta-ketoacyl synthase, C-terminal domain protein [Mycolicibacterium hassiacum DSM 44199]|uniref:Beta-ketoacyl synthase, C-terminal domain protein n=1 Tax=Mycolicibacterium hassiacum (strain DSM 44199 / CIP 105218 / JCM 12690 / 3849) TaxID=1122247 RepID=K5BEE6_MYCHD|nr:type I polyketide synthase [Mycolicibacterium hassiacum]EKF22937.1 beta-ketoacyl synthase, C-terminal domain protein [Mycolicibacterium hassiacum DSM 44199]MDA4087671.1 3-oxoacyl-ACP synthase [Mycolicibacterium hassiacum DSM 44199]VCT89393.1 Beta-ketoacyl-[acyl-carrier-protein] synthase FabY [Mycolicibacterium hassiacum DSM 44199]
MTINEQHRVSTDPRPGAAGSVAGAHALVDRLNAGEPYAVVFGGQGGSWLENLEELVSSAGIESELNEIVREAELLLEPVARELVVVRPIGFEPMQWVRALAAEEPIPTQKQLTTAAISAPGIMLTQIAAIRALVRQGLDLYGAPPVAMAGHSQGKYACHALRAKGARDAEILAILQLGGAAGSLISRRRGMVGRGDKTPMVSVSNVDPDRIAELLEEFSKDVRTVLPPVLSIRNGRRSVVITGTPEQLGRFELYCKKITEKEEAERKNKLRGGAVFSPRFEPVQVEVGFHTPRLQPAVDLMDSWAARTGLDAELAHDYAESVFVKPVDWVAEVEQLADSGAKWFIDLGPTDTATRLTAPIVRGLGIGLVPAATRSGQRSLFTVGAEPEVPPAWSSYAPTTVQLPDGSVKLSTKFTRLTGRSPILLAGMTPTTVDAKIVAAAANAGHWAELAGGGQVTEEIFENRIAELTQLLEPGRAIQFNSLFLDPYLWKLQIGGKRLVQKARQSGAPIDGVVVSAGVPDLEEAVELIKELNSVGISHVVFKPGTIDQIKAVINIASEVPDRDVIAHIEGGRAGGHHSWEDLDDLLLNTYADLRKLPNITICVGGGIGTPERAAEYLIGTWAKRYGFPEMPVDGILVGTAAMATKEATTSPQVKKLLVETTGTDEWVGAGKAVNGMASGRSQLGADIHEIDNSASRCGRLLDEVAGDEEAVQARRDEIIAAMAKTAKPYFGDVGEMTYLQWLRRYIELAIGDGNSTADTARPDSPWIADTWRDRFAEMLKRAEARLHPQDSGPIPTLFADPDLLERPSEAIDLLVRHYPEAATLKLHPADVPWFITLCKTPGKPVNFVPVIDKDVRRWWRSDSLWQAHDARYDADQVCIIPGIQAVAGITRVDEPVGELLDRFEQAAIDRVLAANGTPTPVASRRQARPDLTGPLAVVLDSPDVQWAGRTAINPVHRIGAPSEWQVNDVPGKPSATHPNTGARLETRGDASVVLSVPLSDTWIDIPFTLPPCIVNGGMPMVTVEDASAAMRKVLAIAAGVDGPDALPAVVDGTATVEVDWDPETVADHTGVTATFGPPLAPGLSLVPDALVGLCWPAVFAVIGSAATEDGFPVVEGLLSLVHLDHAAHLLTQMPKSPARLTVTATVSTAFDTEIGRVIPVSVSITDSDGKKLVALEERFAIRGRTGNVELADPPRAGGAITDNANETPRRRRREVKVTAPSDMSAFAVVSGDHNPIHTDRAAALLAGLESPIVHGMWLSAAAQHVVTATDGKPAPPARVVGWTARFLGMVLPGDQIEFRVDRVGIDRGAEIVEVAARVDNELVMSATAQLAAPKTVYAFPGQGIQHKGMGMEVRARSKAARKVWDSADKFTRETLGFSVLHVVRDNPTSLIANGVHYHHPDGVLYLTQFTQVAMATVAAAQVAEMREKGAFVEDAIACGHSVGEYTALACVSGVYELEALLEVVFHRGSKMHDIVPRDHLGRSNYRLAAIRPSQIGLDDANVKDFVAEISERTGEFLEIVNYNLRGSQYAVAGTVRGLEALEEEVERRRQITGGKRSFILVPGIDVPFHSSVLRVGVDDFRRSLERVMPRDKDPDLIVGRYIPNLVPKPFSLDKEFIQEIRDLVPATSLDEVLEDYETWRNERPRELCRKIVIELLAWQFASPVRWIETQDLLFCEEAAGGLGVERFVEIGVKNSPTVAGLAANTLKLPEYSHSTVEVLNAERDAAVLFATDTDPEPEVDEEPAEPEASAPAEATPAPEAPAAPAAPTAAPGAPRPDDLTFDAADATMALIALSAKMRIDQIEPLDSIESITDGASSRRNQLLVDLGSELNLGAIDGAAEADLASLKGQVTKLARTYKPFGPVLSDAINDQLRTVLGPSGKRPAYIAERVKKTWELGDGWAKHVTVEVALGTREGSSVRGGDLGGLHSGALPDAASVDKAIDAAVQAVAARHGVTVTMPSAGGAGGGVVDSAALGEFAEKVTGPNGVLASAARLILDELGLQTPVSLPEATDSELIDLVTAELGSDWPRLVAPAFDSRKAVLLDDRWASAREDLVRIWLMDEDEVDANWARLSERFEGTGHIVGKQATWWQGKALAAGRNIHASLYGRAAAGAENPNKGRYSDEVAVVTGASKGSIAASVVAKLLDGGATVIATTSRLDDERLAFYRNLYRDNARYQAKLWVVPANMASYADIDALVEWVGTEQTESLGPQSIHIKDALTPTLLFPFAAPRVAGDLSEAGSRAEMEMKVLLWAVERLIAGLSRVGAERDIASRLHVVLPGSPNRGMFGGDGAYGEAKSALDAIVARWKAESSWSQRVSLAHALIGWTKGTGLMGHNDVIVDAVEAAGVKTFTTDEMAAMLLDLCTVEAKVAAAREPLTADLTGGLADAELDMAELAAKAREEMANADSTAEETDPPGTIKALPSPPRGWRSAPPPPWEDLDVDPSELVVIVGGAELGPYGSSRTRFEMEVENELSAAGVLELAWTTGLVKWENDPTPGWYDTQTGELVDESELVERYHDAVLERVGIREFVDDGAIDPDHASPLLVSVFLDKDFTFVVSSEEEARAFKQFDPEHTVIAPVPDSNDWQVTRKAGTEIRVPRKVKLSRTVGAQVPTGFDPMVYGVTQEMMNSIDRLSIWNLVTTVDAFLSAGFTPAELMRWVHPSLVASTQGTGMGGMTSMQTMYHGNLLGRNKPNDILQEVLPNVVAAHVMQSYIGSYGAMIHPVGACATAAVSIEEGVDKIRLGKAQFVVAGGYDDLTLEAIIGFGDMAATANTEAMRARGISDARFSRPNDRRRLGFVEGQGGGTILLARGDLALKMGLPVMAVVAYVSSFADGVHTSIPAPGIGALAAGRGGKDSELARSLAKLGVGPDDIAVVSKHDTSTLANDPNETELHERLADALGRSPGAPLFVVSQKSLTGHSKGGAAAFQTIGLCQLLREGVIPPNRSLDCVDDELADAEHLVWVRETLRLGDKFPLKAGLVTSLGFGHVSGLIALVHPQAFIAALKPEEREDYLRRAEERVRAGQLRLASAIAGGPPLYEKPADRRFSPDAPEKVQEAEMLLNPQARLGDDDVYVPFRQ